MHLINGHLWKGYTPGLPGWHGIKGTILFPQCWKVQPNQRCNTRLADKRQKTPKAKLLNELKLQSLNPMTLEGKSYQHSDFFFLFFIYRIRAIMSYRKKDINFIVMCSSIKISIICVYLPIFHVCACVCLCIHMNMHNNIYIRTHILMCVCVHIYIYT